MERIQGNCRLSADGCHARRSARPARVLLSQFEWLVHRRQHEAAGRLLLLGLRRLDERHGALPAGCPRTPGRISWSLGGGHRRPVRRPGLPGLARRLEQFLTLQRWLAAIFGATPFGHADHVIAALAGATPARGGGLALGPRLAQVLCVPAGLGTGRAAGRALGS